MARQSNAATPVAVESAPVLCLRVLKRQEDVTRVMTAIASGQLRATMAEIRGFLGCSHARAPTVRRQLEPSTLHPGDGYEPLSASFDYLRCSVGKALLCHVQLIKRAHKPREVGSATLPHHSRYLLEALSCGYQALVRSVHFVKLLSH